MVETSPQVDSVTSKLLECNNNNNKRARGSSKLSSRNTRRKRRDNRRTSATKLKPPIPSFSCSPIIEDDEEEAENEALIASELVANETTNGPSKVADHTAVNIDLQVERNDGVPADSTNIKAAAVDVVSGLSTSTNGNRLKKEDKSRSISTSPVEAVSDNIEENNNDRHNSVLNSMEEMVPLHAAESTSQHLSNKERIKMMSPVVPDHASTQKTNEQPNKNRNDIKDAKNTNDVLKVPEAITQRPETIELLDDDNDELSGKDVPLIVSRSNTDNNIERGNNQTKPKAPPKKCNRAEKDLISVESSSDDESVTIAKKTKLITQKKKPARRKTTVAKKKSGSKIKEDESNGFIQKDKNKGRCAVCASCTCQAGNDSATIPQRLSTVSLSGSDARVEQTLKNRLLKIERSIALSESQRHECARELKRHRSIVQKKSSKKRANKGERQHFLADAQVTEKMAQAFATAKVERKDAKQAKARVFGKRRSKSNCEPQPTLTQMFGCGGSEKDDVGSDDEMLVDIDDQSCSGDASSEDDNSRSDPRESISFWNDESIGATHQFIGSMIQYDDATTRFKDKQRNNASTWAKAASKMMKDKSRSSQSNEEEEGIVALVELFDVSPKKKSVSMLQDGDCSDDHLLQSQLSQHGALAAQSIKEEIAKDEPKCKAIESVCKNWKENVDYSFRRKDAEGLESALTQVKTERQRLFDMRDKILQAFHERSSTLVVYERAIEGSLKRLAQKENNT